MHHGVLKKVLSLQIEAVQGELASQATINYRSNNTLAALTVTGEQRIARRAKQIFVWKERTHIACDYEANLLL